MSESTHIAPDPESAPLTDVLILPAEYFFTERIEVPPALAASELSDFAELSMETIAPFPLEQLYWGFLTAPDGQAILIYAALKDRLNQAGHSELETYIWVLPDFATLQGARFDSDTEVFLQGATFDTVFSLSSGEAMPKNIHSLARVGDAPRNSSQCIHLKLLPIELSEKGTPIFQFETLNETSVSGHWSPLEPDEATLWQTDIRAEDFKAVERSVRRNTGLITQIMGYAAIFAILLVLLEGLFFIGQFWLRTRESKIEAQTTSVRRVEDKQSLMNKLEQVAQNELRPIAILESANQIRINLGKTGIEYDEVVIEDGNRLTIEGKANTINELNAYTTALRSSGNFQLNDEQSITRSGKTSFTVTLDYTHSLSSASESERTAPNREGGETE